MTVIWASAFFISITFGQANSNLPPCQGESIKQWDLCAGTHTYPNGNKYIGEYRSGLRDGKGTIRIVARGTSNERQIASESPATYSGDFRNDKLNGYGSLVFDDGQKIEGKFVNNLFESKTNQTNIKAETQGQGVGPGWLLIHGGGKISAAEREKFIALAGGANANYVVIPTSLPDDEIDLQKITRRFQSNLGSQNVTVLHTRDRNTANDPKFSEALTKANGIWLDGGRQWRYVDAYLNTKVEERIKDALSRGAVIFGSSAGATIQGEFLVRGAPGTFLNPAGDNRIIVAKGYTQGFGLFPKSVIDQHIDTRGRENDLRSVVRRHPNLIGIGLNQDAAIVVHKDELGVLEGKATIWNANDAANDDHYVLAEGERFDLVKRKRTTP